MFLPCFKKITVILAHLAKEWERGRKAHQADDKDVFLPKKLLNERLHREYLIFP